MKVEVSVSKDRMSAYVTLIPDEEGETISQSDILKALDNAGIKYGILKDRIDQLTVNPIYRVPQLVAVGKPPVDGKDGEIELIKKVPEYEEILGGKVDLKSMPSKKRILVKRGEKIARIIPPTRGHEGKDVFGLPVKPKPGKDPQLNLGKNVKREGDVLIAVQDGLLVVKDDGTIDVEETLIVPENVDYSVGNIDFPGSVEVKGDVRPDFVVKAKGDVVIKGVAEASTVISLNGDVEVHGAKGRGKGLIKARKNVKAYFLENVEVEAGLDVIVDRSIENSKVKAGRSVEVTRGIIVGGVITAGYSVIASEIGSSLGVSTRVEVGVDPLVRERLKVLEAQIKLDEENIRKLTKVLMELRKLMERSGGKLPPDKLEMLMKVSQTLINLRESLDRNRKEYEALKEDSEKKAKGAQIIARSVLYPGVEISIFDRKFYVERILKKAIVFYQDGEIKIGGYKE